MQWLSDLFSNSKKEDAAKRRIFFDVIQKNNGSISVMDFALAADISGADAKKALEQYAVEFDATFEVTEQGYVNYIFPVSTNTETTETETLPQTPPKENTNKKAIDDSVEQKPDNNSPLERVSRDIEQKKAEIAKVEEDLRNLGKSLNDKFRF